MYIHLKVIQFFCYILLSLFYILEGLLTKGDIQESCSYRRRKERCVSVSLCLSSLLCLLLLSLYEATDVLTCQLVGLTIIRCC